MSPLSSIDGLSEAAAWAAQVASTLTTGQTVVLDGAADVNVVLGLVQLEAALLDRGLPYRRALSPSMHFLPASERVPLVVGANEVQCSVVEETDAHPSLPAPDGPVHRIVPVGASVELGRDQRQEPARCVQRCFVLWWQNIWLPQERGCAGFALGCCLLNGAVEPLMRVTIQVHRSSRSPQ